MTSDQSRRSRSAGTNPRALGTNPRALGTNPRALATNPTAGADSDRRRITRTTAVALAVIHAAGVVWCHTCGDGGSLETAAGWVLCPCRPMPAERAARIAERFGHHVRPGVPSYALEAPGVADRLERMLRPP